MDKLKASTRNALPASKFGLPGKRAFPIPDRSHAVAAKSRATQGVEAGTLSAAQASKIRARANKVLSASK